jgi:replicative DNA helicase
MSRSPTRKRPCRVPSAGKTGHTNYIADNICLTDHPVLFFSYDDGLAELRYRTFSRFTGFGIEDFNQRKVSKNDMQAIFKSDQIKKIIANKYVVQEMIKIEDWPKMIEKIKARHQKAPVIIIDYLRKLKTEKSNSDERLRVDEILSNLTNLAKTHNTPIIAISELARDSYKSGQRLSIASFKESGSIEYEASWLGILAAVEEKNGEYILKNNWERIIEQDGNVDLIVFKAKRGTGVTGKIPLKMDKNKMIVKDRADVVRLDSNTKLAKSSIFN